MSSGRLPLDSSYKKLFDERHLRDTALTKIQPIVAWQNLMPIGLGAKGGGTKQIYKARSVIKNYINCSKILLTEKSANNDRYDYEVKLSWKFRTMTEI